MDKILLFIPMYNCEKQIVRVLNQLDGEAASYFSEAIVVNNRSRDASEQAVIDFLNITPLKLPVSLLRNDENYNLGGSHKVAFQYALDNSFDYIVVLHGDDQGSLKDIIPHLQEGVAQRYDSFLGARFMKKSKLVNYSKFRIFGNYVFNTYFSIITGKIVKDLGSGLNMYKVSYLASQLYLPFPNTLTFNVYMLLFGIYNKSKFRFFPLTWREEDQVSNAKFTRQSKELLKLSKQYVFNRKKLFSGANIAPEKSSYTYQLIYTSRVEAYLDE